MDDAAPGAGRPETRLALIELQGRDGRPLQAVAVRAWPLTLGRALDNDIVIDDPYVAPHHATLAPNAEGRLLLAVGDTANGVLLGSRRLAAGSTEPLPAGGAGFTLGQTALRLRLPGEVLAPERLLLPARGLAPAAGAAALLLALVLAKHWVSLDPGADTAAWLPMLAGMPVAVALWCGLWALASKIFQHRFEFVAHLRIVLPWLLGIELVDTFGPPLAAALAWPGLWRLVPPLQLLLAALLVRQHLVQLLPQAGRRVSVAVASALLVGGAISLALTHRATDRLSRPPYMSTLPWPGLHGATPVEPAQLVQELEPLAAQLAERVQRARAEEGAGKAEGDDVE
jgi:hypothetical protein